MACKDIFLFILSIIAKSIILFLGWHLFNEEVSEKFNKYKRTVMIFSHTSYFDFFVFVIYLLAYPQQLNRVRTLVKPQPFEYAGYFLRLLGAIPSTRIQDKNGGAINRIISELKLLDNFVFLISPKGTIIKAPWKKGYYHITKELSAELMVIGFDYELKQIRVLNNYSFKEYTEDKLVELLKEDISKIVPLYPECEVVKIRKHNELNRGVIDITPMFTLSCILSCLCWGYTSNNYYLLIIMVIGITYQLTRRI